MRRIPIETSFRRLVMLELMQSRTCSAQGTTMKRFGSSVKEGDAGIEGGKKIYI